MRTRSRVWPTWRTILLCLVVLVPGTVQLLADDHARSLLRALAAREAAVAAGLSLNRLPAGVARAQQPPPALSDAPPIYPPNHMFDAVPEATGAPPSNADYEAAPEEIGDPPSNFDLAEPGEDVASPANNGFGSGDFTDWTTGGSPTIQTGGPTGDWARLPSGASVTSADFAVPSEAQVFLVEVNSISASSWAGVKLSALTGPSFGTSTQIFSDSCNKCGVWKTAAITAAPYRDQTIKLKAEYYLGAVGVDEVRARQSLIDYETVGVALREPNEGQNGAGRLEGNGAKATSAAFEIPEAAQNLTVAMKGLSAGTDQFYLWVLSGAGFATEDRVLIVTNMADAWTTWPVSVVDYRGEEIKLRVERQAGVVGFDDLGQPRIEVVDWDLEGSAAYAERKQGGPSGDGHSVMLGTGQLTSAPFALAEDAQQLTVAYRADNAGASFVVELLHGQNFEEVEDLSGSVTGDVNAWLTGHYVVGPWAGEEVRLRLRRTFGRTRFDEAGLGEIVAPGWTPTANSQAIAWGEDAGGTYLTNASESGGMFLRSAELSAAYVDKPSGFDARFYSITYQLEETAGNQVWVTWEETGGNATVVFAVDTQTTQTEPVTRYFFVPESLGTLGRFVVKAVHGKVYAIGDNVAREHLAEAFSQKVGDGVDTSTGALGYGMTDLSIDGGPMPLAFTRFYVGHADTRGVLGYRWTHTYETRLVIDGDSVAVVHGSGAGEFFQADAQDDWIPADARNRSTLEQNQDGSWTLVTSKRLTLHFMGSGLLSHVEDVNFNAITLTRDGQDRIVEIEDPGGRAITLAYDGQGRLASATDPEGAVVEYGYGGDGDLETVTLPDDTEWHYGYSRHRLETVTDPNDQVVLTNELDGFDRVVSQTDELGNELSFAYESPGRGATEVTDPLGETTIYHFDRWGRTIYIQDPLDATTAFFYDDLGNLERWVDPYNDDTEFDFAGDGTLSTITDPLGQPIEVEYNPERLPTETTDARGNLWLTGYDARGNVLSTTNPLDQTWSYTYDARGNRLTETSPLGHAWVNTYDAANNRLTRTDPLDHEWSWTYNARGQITSATDPTGATMQWGYDLSRLLQTMTDPALSVWEFDYNLTKSLTRTTDPLGQQTSWVYFGGLDKPTGRFDALNNLRDYTYDAGGRVTSVRDELGVITNYTFTAEGKLASQVVDPGGGQHLNLTTEYEYNANGVLIRETDPLGRATEYAYDEAGRLVGKELPSGAAWTVEYDASGNLTSITDPLLRESTATYDAANRLVSVTDADGQTTSYGYDADGRKTSETNALDQTTEYEYNDAGWLIEVTDPLDHTTQFEYDAEGKRTAVIDAAGEATNYEYDLRDRLIRVTDPLNRTTNYEYDALGRLTKTILPSGRETVRAYDAMGRLTGETVDPGQGGLNLTTLYEYDDAGRRTKVTNPRGYVTRMEYDAAGRMVKLIDADDGEVSFAYDAAGQLLAVTNPRGKTTSYEYDSLGNVTEETDPLGRFTTHTYDVMGRRLTSADGRGVQVEYGYDDLDRLIGITYPAYGGEAGGVVGFAYDDVGRRTSMTDATGTTSWTYDDGGRVTAVTSPQGDLAYGYDDVGRRTGLTLPGNRAVAYAYDIAGQLASVTDWESRTTTFAYDGDGRLGGLERPNGVESAFTYDDAGRLTGIGHEDGSGVVQSFAYLLDATGNRTQVTSAGVPVPGVETYGYDELDRLTSVGYADGGGATYAYDANGNRTSLVSGGQTTNYSYDDADQLTALSGATNLSYTYDGAGNRLSAGSDQFAYDWRNRLVEAEVGGDVVAYAYSGDDLRVSRTEDAVTVPLLWDRLEGLPELVDDGERVFLQLGGGELASITDDDSATYPLHDAVGTARGRTDGTGVLIASADYDAFGTLRASTGTQGPLGWTGELADPTTGLVYLRARDYAPGSGRFLQVDPLMPSAPGTQGYHRYAYVRNNPATATDPSGHGEDGDPIAAALRAMEALVGVASDMLNTYRDQVPMVQGIFKAVLGLLSFVIVFVVPLLINIAISMAIKKYSPNLTGGALIATLWKARLVTWGTWIAAKCALRWYLCRSIGQLVPKLTRRCLAALGEALVGAGSEAAFRVASMFVQEQPGDVVDSGTAAGVAAETGAGCVNLDGKIPDWLKRSCAASFAGGTPVLLADGTTKPIREVEVGDRVVAADPATGERGAREVTAKHVGIGKRLLVAIALAGAVATPLVATAEHEVWRESTGEWVQARELRAGDELTDADGDAVDIAGVRAYTEDVPVHSLTVAGLATYHVGDAGDAVLVHNCQRFRYTLGPNDLNWQDTGATVNDALAEAFKRTGVPGDQFEVTEYVWYTDSSGVKRQMPVEWESPSGAQVSIDHPHVGNPDAPDAPHVGWQSPGKRSRGEGARGHIFLDSVPYGRDDPPVAPGSG